MAYELTREEREERADRRAQDGLDTLKFNVLFRQFRYAGEKNAAIESKRRELFLLWREQERSETPSVERADRMAEIMREMCAMGAKWSPLQTPDGWPIKFADDDLLAELRLGVDLGLTTLAPGITIKPKAPK